MNRELRKLTREQRSKSVIQKLDKLAENQSQTRLSEEQQDQRIQSSPAGQTRLSEVEQDQRIQLSSAGQTWLFEVKRPISPILSCPISEDD